MVLRYHEKPGHAKSSCVQGVDDAIETVEVCDSETMKWRLGPYSRGKVDEKEQGEERVYVH